MLLVSEIQIISDAFSRFTNFRIDMKALPSLKTKSLPVRINSILLLLMILAGLVILIV